MKPQQKETSFNSKELNKILPSYLLDEIDKEEKKDLNNKNDKQFNDFVASKESKKVRYLLIIIEFIFIG